MIQIDNLHPHLCRYFQLRLHIFVQSAAAQVILPTGLSPGNIPAVAGRRQDDPLIRKGLLQKLQSASQRSGKGIFIPGILLVINGNPPVIVVQPILDQQNFPGREIYLCQSINGLVKIIRAAFPNSDSLLRPEIMSRQSLGQSRHREHILAQPWPAFLVCPAQAGSSQRGVEHRPIQEPAQQSCN